MKLDLNSDLGEGEPIERTRALLRWVTSANIACGGHAGDEITARATVQACLQNHVNVGAHPGLPDRENFGRVDLPVSVQAFLDLLEQQVSWLERICKDGGTAIHHIKLHGALYHLSERNGELRQAYIAFVQELRPIPVIFSLAGGEVQKAAEAAGLEVWPEGFLDRAYQADGTLRSRAETGAMLSMPAIMERLEAIREGAFITTIRGGKIQLRARTWCLHSDTPAAVEAARASSLALQLRSDRGSRATL